MQFALVDGAVPMRMQELDRILDGDDVPRLFLVDLVDDCGQRRTFTGTGWARHKHDSVDQRTDVAKLRRKVQHFEGRNAVRDDAHDDRVGTALRVDVGPKTRGSRKALRKDGGSRFAQ